MSTDNTNDTAESTSNAASNNPSTMTIAEAMAAHKRARTLHKDAEAAYNTAFTNSQQLIESHKLAIAERERADFFCARIKIFRSRMEDLSKQHDSALSSISAARQYMLDTYNEREVLEAGGSMRHFEQEITSIVAEAMREVARLSEELGVDLRLPPSFKVYELGKNIWCACQLSDRDFKVYELGKNLAVLVEGVDLTLPPSFKVAKPTTIGAAVLGTMFLPSSIDCGPWVRKEPPPLGWGWVIAPHRYSQTKDGEVLSLSSLANDRRDKAVQAAGIAKAQMLSGESKLEEALAVLKAAEAELRQSEATLEQLVRSRLTELEAAGKPQSGDTSQAA
jgi:hypothetical protein